MRVRTLQSKLMVLFGLCLVVTVAGVVVNGYFFSKRTETHVTGAFEDFATRLSRDHLEEKARAMGNQIQVQLEVALDTARTLAQILSGLKDPETRLEMNREQVNGILKTVLERNPDFVGVYTCWEPNALDGLDDLYANSPGHDGTGRFIPYWSRTDDGEITLSPLVDYETEAPHDNGVPKGAYYLLPRLRKRECAIDPYPYPVGGRTVWITSLVAPITVGDEFHGIAGVDLRLDFIQKQAMEARAGLYEDAAELAVVSHNGILAAHSESPDRVGRSLAADDASGHVAETLEKIRAGQPESHTLGDEIHTIVPMSVGLTGTPWAVFVKLPRFAMLAEVRAVGTEMADQHQRSIVRQIGIGGLIGLAGLAVILVASRRMTGPIRRVIAGLEASHAEVAAAADQIASASQSLAEGASEQAASLEETSSALEQMDSMTQRNAAHARQADELMKGSDKVVRDAETGVTGLRRSMSEISDAGDHTAKIIQTIDDIAFQTNLLALNASVEAARAGETGAGFAVVADAVRSLAMKATESARETAGIIDGTVKRVQLGVESVNRTADAFSKVSDSVGKGGELVAEIAAASDEQAQGIAQISRAVAEMDRVTQRNAASAEESASAAAEMNAQADRMHDHVAALVRLIGQRRPSSRRRSYHDT